ncbi:hypothetical protein TNCV_4913291 [Trichonephila clavipes]|nr:hypothetical protein TNCV_4913291 [Trichonephila clavipes]
MGCDTLYIRCERDKYFVLYAPSEDKNLKMLCQDFWMVILTATAGSDVVQSGRPIFDDFFQHLCPYIGNNTANVVFQMVKQLWLIRIDK